MKMRNSTLLQAALDRGRLWKKLRYNNIVIATDDVDGMHIRLLLITFSCNFFPELIKEGHLYILQTLLSGFETKRNHLLLLKEERKQLWKN
jgi:DNA gyrase/topoisomerase IV subunit B